MTIRVYEADAASSSLLDDLNRLLPQLSSSAPPLQADDLAELVGSPATVLFVAEDDVRGVLGSLTLVLFRIPTGVRAWIEDVVVDDAARGRGVGSRLVERAVQRAEAAGARSVDLTSRPSRLEANRLYQRLGFSVRETNVYRRSLEPDS